MHVPLRILDRIHRPDDGSAWWRSPATPGTTQVPRAAGTTRGPAPATWTLSASREGARSTSWAGRSPSTPAGPCWHHARAPPVSLAGGARRRQV